MHMKYAVFRHLKFGLIALFLVIVFSISILALFYISSINRIVHEVNEEMDNDFTTYKNTFMEKVSGVSSDTIIMKQLIETNDVLSTDGTTTTFTSPAAKQIIESSMVVLMQTTNLFDQIRIIDNQGMEISRANYNNGEPSIVADVDLQDKSDRYYYQHTTSLEDNDIYLSVLDLNSENGTLEIIDGAYKPVLRIVVPLYDDTEEKMGILVVNYLVNDLLNHLTQNQHIASAQIEMINADGYYLLAADPTIAFGFMFDDKQDETVDKYNAFDVIGHASTSIQQFKQDSLLYTLLSLQTLDTANYISDQIGTEFHLISESGPFILFGQVNYKALPEYQTNIQRYLILLVIVLLLSFLLTRLLDELYYIRKEKLANYKYLAKHDYLTGLPNRQEIYELIQKAMDEQSSFALMFIDVDEFKDINDRYGHDVGDMALVAASKRIVNHLRSTDVVARIGGDEFLALLYDVNHKESLKKIAENLLDQFKDAFVFDEVKLSIHLSIGITTNHGISHFSDLIVEADKAMYYVKAHQKNNYAFYDLIKK